MKFLTNTDLSNASKDIKHILSHELRNAIDELGDKYDFDDNTIDSLSYSLYVSHNSKVQFKTGKTKFTKAYEKSVVKLIDESDLSFEDLGFLMYLSAKLTSHEDNYLRIDGELASKNEIIEYLINEINSNISANTLRRRFKSVEDMNLLLVENSPIDKKKKFYYLSPLLFYKGKYMDSKARTALLKLYKDMYTFLKQKVDNGELEIELKVSFDKMTDDEILLMATKYIQ